MTKQAKSEIGTREFIALLAAASALTALAIDTMLPAFSDIRSEFGFNADSTRVSLLVTVFFIGIAGGQFAYGPASDRFGRKPTLAVGLGIYIVGAVGSSLAPSFELLIVSRIIWGIGAAGPRVVTLAILRDRFSGDQMARVMLFVQSIFMVVPVLAPMWGKLWLSIGSWRWTFGQAVGLAILLSIWSLRLPETLAASDRRSLNGADLRRSLRQIFGNRQTMGMAMAQTFMLGAFFPWLGSSELIVTELYGRGSIYAYVFAGTAMVMGASTLVSTRAVGRYGARLVVRTLVTAFAGVALVATLITGSGSGLPALPVFLGLVCVLLGLEIAMTPNAAALALEPMGHIAGITSSVVGTMNFALGAFLAFLVDSKIDGTVTPLFLGMAIYGSLAAMCVFWATGGYGAGRDISV